MTSHDDCAIDEQIRQSLPDDLPPAIEERLRTQLNDFRSRFNVRPLTSQRRNRLRMTRGWRIGVASAAAALALLAIGLAVRPQPSFAEVAQEVLKQPWIHVQSTRGDKIRHEAWYSSAKDVMAFVSDDSIQFHDYRTQIHHSYDLKTQTLYRMPEFGSRDLGIVTDMISVLGVIAQSEQPPDNPLDDLALFVGSRQRMNVLDQRLNKVNEGGKEWIDYHLTVSSLDAPDPLKIVFRVDAKTMLLRSCRMSGSDKGESAKREMRFDYPETGPADIFAMNVPRSATLVDRVPAGDMKRIVESLRAGRERMDPYRTIFVATPDAPKKEDWQLELPMVIYRKGDRFRADYVGKVLSWQTVLPAENTDMRKWWEKRLGDFLFYPQYVIRGPTTYVSETKNVTDADGSEHIELAAIKSWDSTCEMIPIDYSMRPEFACRPPLGVGGQHSEPAIDLNPADGPKGCILLTVGNKSDQKMNKKGVGLPDEWRYWLDPARDYIAMRWDLITRDTTGAEKLVSSHQVEETARSPHGVWYATKIRHKGAVTTPDGKKLDQIYHLYVDFDVDLPDAFFDPPKKGRVR